MSDYIQIDTTVPGGKGSGLSNTIASGRTFRDGLQNFKGQMEEMVVGGSFTEVETRFGLASGDGETVYNLVAGALADMEASDGIGQLLTRLA